MFDDVIQRFTELTAKAEERAELLRSSLIYLKYINSCDKLSTDDKRDLISNILDRCSEAVTEERNTNE